VSPDSFVNDTQNIIIEDTFSGYNSLWQDQTGEKVFSRLEENCEYQLILDKLDYKITSSPLADVAYPAIAVSLTRQDLSADSYFGIFFLDKVFDNFEVRVLGDCTVQVFENMSLVAVSNNSVDYCSKNENEYIEFLVRKEQLTVKINGLNSDVGATSSTREGHFG